MSATDPVATDAAALLGGIASELLVLAALGAVALLFRLRVSRR